jgi:hypothetical protein
MSRALIGRVFAGGIAAIAIGLLLGQASIALGRDLGVYIADGETIVGLRVMPIGFVVVALASGAVLSLAGGAMAVAVAWAAALANARAAARGGWFASLLLLGLPTFGIGALIPYVVAGPDRAPSGA